MSKKREYKEGNKNPKISEKEEKRAGNERSGNRSSRPGYLQPKDKKGTSRFKSGSGNNFKKNESEKSYNRKGENKNKGRSESRPRFLQPKDENSKSIRGEKPYKEKDSFRTERKEKSSFGRGKEDKSSYSEGAGKLPYSKNRVQKPSFGNRDENKNSFRKEKDVNPKSREGKTSYSEKRTSNRKYKVEKPFKTDRRDKSDNEEIKDRRSHSFKNYNDKSEGKERKGSYLSERRPRSRKPLESENAEPKIDLKSQKSGEIRLNRYIANAGICSRRDADLLIQAGEITVNGKVVTEMGYKVNYSDEVRYNNRRLKREKLVYILLNKPKDFITTTDDPENRKTIMQLVEGAGSERIYPVGRLDRNTTGLILLTNDGELADKLSHPSNNIKKLYQVDLDKPIAEEDFEKIKQGVVLEDGLAEVDQIALVSSDKTSLGLQIHSGKNRIVRRIFEHLGYDVVKLDRVMYAGLDKKDLPRGKWRSLSEQEVIRLKYMK